MNDSSLTSIPSSHIMVMLSDRGAAGTIVLASVSRLRPPGAMDVDDVGGGSDILVLAES